MRIAIFTSFFAPAFLGGGPIRTLTAMIKDAPTSADTAVIASNTDLGCDDPLDVVSDKWVKYQTSKAYYCRPSSPRSLFNAMRSVRRWSPDAIYVNSFFDPRYSVLPQLLYVFGFFHPRSFVVAPRGEFSEGALRLKAWKKALYIRLFRLVGLSARILWHASTSNEANDIRGLFGENVKIIVRENDTELPSSASLPTAERAEGRLRIVSLSRLSPKKGVETLLEALQYVRSPIVLDIIGPAEDSEYFKRCQQLAEVLPANVQVSFLGAKPHEEVRESLSSYDVMACPTLGENFGHVIAESLSVSCPVICADVTPWTARLRAGAGVVVSENTPAGWASIIDAYAELSPADILERRLASGAVYNNWKSGSAQPHFFSLLEEETSPLNT